LKTSGFVPHKKPVLIVNKLIEVLEKSSVSEAEITEDMILQMKTGNLMMRLILK